MTVGYPIDLTIDPLPDVPKPGETWHLPNSKCNVSEPVYESDASSLDEASGDEDSIRTDCTMFDQYRLPSSRQLQMASILELLDEDGNSTPFGDVYPEGNSSTVVFFIRGLICGQCQDYMRASIARLDPDTIAAAKVRVVIITNGSWKGIKQYRQMMKCPFPMYVDPTLDLYRFLGMSPNIKVLHHFKSPKDKGTYHQRSPLSQVVHGAANAARLRVRDIGSIKQLGGEFVLLPGYRCSYAHRMTNKYNHVMAADVLRAAGVQSPELLGADELDSFICTLPDPPDLAPPSIGSSSGSSITFSFSPISSNIS